MWLPGVVCPAGVPLLITTEAHVHGSGCARGIEGPWLLGGISFIPSLTRSTHLCRHLCWRARSRPGEEKSQWVSVLSCWTAGDRGRQGLEGDGEGVSKGHWDCIHSRSLLVMLVPVCPRGQVHPCPADGHASQSHVWKDLSVAEWPRGPSRTSIVALFQETGTESPCTGFQHCATQTPQAPGSAGRMWEGCLEELLRQRPRGPLSCSGREASVDMNVEGDWPTWKASPPSPPPQCLCAGSTNKSY